MSVDNDDTSVSSVCAVSGDQQDYLVRLMLQSKIPQMFASKPFIAVEEDLHWRGMLETYVYRVCSIDWVPDSEKELFWKQWKPEVQKMMRVRKHYVIARIRRKIVSEYSASFIDDCLQCVRVFILTF